MKCVVIPKHEYLLILVLCPAAAHQYFEIYQNVCKMTLCSLLIWDLSHPCMVNGYNDQYTMPIQSEAVPPLQQKMEERRDTKLVCFIFYLKCFYCLFCAIIQLISQISLQILVYKTFYVQGGPKKSGISKTMAITPLKSIRKGKS